MAKTSSLHGTHDGPEIAKAVLISAFLIGALVAGSATAQSRFTTAFRLEDCTFSSVGDQNPYLNLTPGYQLSLLGEDDGQPAAVRITVLDETETITFETMGGVELTVEARVVEEREWVDGKLDEVSRNWFARCVETSDIYYFGEEVVPDDGDGWRAGEDGAFPGLIMPGTFLLGSRYFQEIAPGVALDRAEHMLMGLEIRVPAGTFNDCVVVRETNPLDPGEAEPKAHCPGVGLVIDEGLRLVDFGLSE